jgi:hypothetical protein
MNSFIQSGSETEQTEPPVRSGREAQRYDTLNGGPFMDYLNSTRGRAFAALIAALAARGDVEGQWAWVEAMAEEPRIPCVPALSRKCSIW